ncbi:PQ loop repeat protein [Aspergillus affinis]|uniref:PQ loop repeat protein n=1 Tax=Aspergillus affinis TaxID=1070780 RepID=UPI0022FE35D1|nr:PQ loop repeat protein [Aspergillus affinis]KAI9042904.1 PQ loop repeat protein [Aspergillus affinis]
MSSSLDSKGGETTAKSKYWLRRFFSHEEVDDIEHQGSPGFNSFKTPHDGCYKEPDSAFIHVNEMAWPCVVIESGVSESSAKLVRDRNIWLEGGHVNAVLAMKFYVQKNKTVTGKAQIFRPGGNNSPEGIIFPAPSAAGPQAPQTISFYRKDFYPNGQVPSGRDGNDEWKWDMDQLRIMVTRNMATEGLNSVWAMC